ncbi:PREDICTED: protein unc-93 homolog A-like [Priapulus caudatus]|uniref:Protein unc-93 homolog A-like n=1 Tax=Priapulus caudatus TaxID=37621 RepID=A0ABM1DPB9_PRICU|nr:PREDICTED: protein unc-93 homolog A-like [Priapulus caudatus]
MATKSQTRSSSTKELVATAADPLTPDVFRRKLVILKNVCVISGAFLLLFTAFQSLQNLQSSVNRDEGLGLASLSIIYGSLVVSCTLLPTTVVARLGCKWTIVIAMLVYSVYMLANLHAAWYTLVPASIALGTAAAPLWTAKCKYLTETGGEYARLEGTSTEAVVNRFFGIFFLMFQSGQIWGNLISSSVFQTSAPNETVPADIVEAYCGAAYCAANSASANITNVNLAPPPRSRVMLLMGIYFACAVAAAALVAAIVDQLRSDEQRDVLAMPTLRELLATARHLSRPDQLLLIPLTFYSGVEQAFIAADFTLAYVTCSVGVHMVGYSMITFGVADAAFSFIGGRLVQYVGRAPIFCVGFVAHLATIVVLLMWKPHADGIVTFLAIAAGWGVGDAVWQTQINAFYGVTFPDSTAAAFSNYRLWESLGFLMTFAYGNFLCVSVKLYVVLAFLLTGMAGYGAVEIRHRCVRQRNQYNVS